MKQIHITIKDLKLLVDTVERMPASPSDTGAVMITHDNSSGIGYNLYVTKCIEINGLHGEFKVEISDPEAW